MDLVQRAINEGACLGDGSYDTERYACRRANGANGLDKQEFLPLRNRHVLGEDGHQSGATERGGKAGDLAVRGRCARGSGTRSVLDHRGNRGMSDVSGTDLLHQHPPQSFKDMGIAQHRGQECTGLHAVLQGDHHGGRSHHRLQRRGQVCDLGGLHTHEDDINHAHTLGVVGHLHGGQRQITVDAFQNKPARCKGGQRGPAREEDDVMTGLLQAGAEHTADGAGADHGNAKPVGRLRCRVGCAHGLPMEKPAMCASVLCPMRKPTTPSVLLSFPAVTRSALL